MTNGLENLASMEYPGRVIIMGNDPDGNDVIGYAITGRSDSSRARAFMQEGDSIKTVVTDPEQLKKGNPNLLIYPVIEMDGDFIAVSNGAQTELIYKTLKGICARGDIGDSSDALRAAFQKPSEIEGIDVTKYEPDAPNFTPRISGLLTSNGGSLSIIKRGNDDSVIRQYIAVPFEAGSGKMISTYTGVNANPLPSFDGDPLDVKIDSLSAKDFAEKFYDALAPKQPDKDFRVGVVTVYVSVADGSKDVHIINRNKI
jgi:IMP cyclohydrolase